MLAYNGGVARLKFHETPFERECRTQSRSPAPRRHACVSNEKNSPKYIITSLEMHRDKILYLSRLGSYNRPSLRRRIRFFIATVDRPSTKREWYARVPVYFCEIIHPRVQLETYQLHRYHRCDNFRHTLLRARLRKRRTFSTGSAIAPLLREKERKR